MIKFKIDNRARNMISCSFHKHQNATQVLEDFSRKNTTYRYRQRVRSQQTESIKCTGYGTLFIIPINSLQSWTRFPEAIKIHCTLFIGWIYCSDWVGICQNSRLCDNCVSHLLLHCPLWSLQIEFGWSEIGNMIGTEQRGNAGHVWSGFGHLGS